MVASDHAVASAVDLNSITFSKLRSRSLLIAQRKGFVNALQSTFTTISYIEYVRPDEHDEVEYVPVSFISIDVASDPWSRM